MKFNLEKFKGDELTGSKELAKWIAENYNVVPDYGNDPNNIKRLTIEVREWDDDLDYFITVYDDLEWIVSEMGSSRDIWVCWTEDEGELIE